MQTGKTQLCRQTLATVGVLFVSLAEHRQHWLQCGKHVVFSRTPRLATLRQKLVTLRSQICSEGTVPTKPIVGSGVTGFTSPPRTNLFPFEPRYVAALRPEIQNFQMSGPPAPKVYGRLECRIRSSQEECGPQRLKASQQSLTLTFPQ